MCCLVKVLGSELRMVRVVFVLFFVFSSEIRILWFCVSFWCVLVDWLSLVWIKLILLFSVFSLIWRVVYIVIFWGEVVVKSSSCWVVFVFFLRSRGLIEWLNWVSIYCDSLVWFFLLVVSFRNFVIILIWCLVISCFIMCLCVVLLLVWNCLISVMIFGGELVYILNWNWLRISVMWVVILWLGDLRVFWSKGLVVGFVF